ncbi:AbrB/MazE/SpoVT family DNA-binding domain-containing protein [Idiomarina sp. Sol25]|uniref:AbrB/MazE/SpoVT family DNA-binding domain-containing protein n=1 Tax=Idiomarina sp. Sol25 TaxID=3064000 RepID=UPI00294AF332|nr:AbrB/MazE/SpoVT family DNA-binding domain-containing protein [Idiomarina sp. Sol25]MDV6328550.1 AbrB/MazE/SpoVT family DNA-binding domain-containing protein [Idiomarina sp. Sol25]
MKSVIQKLGDSKAIIIPAALMRELGLDVNDEVEVKLENGRIVIELCSKPDYSLDELLVQCEPEAMVLDEESQVWLSDVFSNKEIN